MTTDPSLNSPPPVSGLQDKLTVWKINHATFKEAVIGHDVAQGIGFVSLLGCRCRCGHEWLPRTKKRPRICPKCKSENWDKPKKWSRK